MDETRVSGDDAESADRGPSLNMARGRETSRSCARVGELVEDVAGFVFHALATRGRARVRHMRRDLSSGMQMRALRRPGKAGSLAYMVEAVTVCRRCSLLHECLWDESAR